MSAESVGQIGLDLVVNKNVFQKQMGGILNLATKAGKALAAAFAVKKIVDFGAACIDLGSDLQEVQNVVDVTFPALSKQVDKFAQDAAASFGLSETMAKRFTGTFGSMAKAFGFSEEAAYAMSTTLTGLAGDVASFYNISQDEAYTKLKAVFTGETESLKDLGIVMTQTALDSYALANGFGKTTAKMTEAEKVALRYKFVQEQLTGAAGDFQRTSDGWANQVRVLKLQFDSFKATIGQGLINVLTPVIKLINTLLGKLMTLANAFKAFTEMLVGKKDTAATQMQEIADAADGAASSTEAVGEAVEEAAKKMRGLYGFDELQVVDNDSEDSGSIDLGVGEVIVDSTTESAKQTEGLVDQVEKKFSGLVAFLRRCAKNIKDIFKDISVGDFFSAGQKVSDLASDILEFLTDALDTVDWDAFGEAVGKFLKGIEWETLLSDVGELIWKAINAAVDVWQSTFDSAPIETTIATALATLTFTSNIKLTLLVTGIAVAFGEVTKRGNSIGKSFAEQIANSYGWDGSKVWEMEDMTIKEAVEYHLSPEFDKDIETIRPMVEYWLRENSMEWATPIADYFLDVWKLDPKESLSKVGESISQWWDNDVAPWFTKEKWSELYENIKTSLSDKWGEVEEWWNNTALVRWWTDDVAPWFTKEKWTGLYENIKTALSDKWKEVKDWWNESALVKWWKDSVEPWFKKEKWVGAMTGIKDGFKEAFKNACNAAIDIFNRFITWVNDNMHFSWDAISIAGKQIVPPGEVQLFSIPQIPMLAQGGYVKRNTPQLAVIGDNKRQGEIVAPEDKMYQISFQAMTDAMKQFLQLLQMNQVQQGGGDLNLVISGELAPLFRLFKIELEKEDERIGKDFRVVM